MAKRKAKTIDNPAGGSEQQPGNAEQPMEFDMEGAGSLPKISDNPEVARYEIAKRIAHMLANSRMVPDAYRGRPADCFIAMQMGHEVGMNPFTAVQSIAVIDGRPCLYGDALIGVVRASPLCEWITESYDMATKTATCTTKRKGEPEPVIRAFSWDMATMAGLVNKDPWKKYGPRMLQMRARSWCLRDAYPDVLKGLRIAEEVMDYSNEPAPITDFALPPPVGETARQAGTGLKRIEDSPEPLTYEYVADEFDKATTIAKLLEASQLTKRLASEEDIAKARVKYRERKAQLEGAQA